MRNLSRKQAARLPRLWVRVPRLPLRNRYHCTHYKLQIVITLSRSSPECSPPCQGGDRGFKSHRERCDCCCRTDNPVRLVVRVRDGSRKTDRIVHPTSKMLVTANISLRTDRCPAGSHKPGPSGSLPESATEAAASPQRVEGRKLRVENARLCGCDGLHGCRHC